MLHCNKLDEPNQCRRQIDWCCRACTGFWIQLMAPEALWGCASMLSAWGCLTKARYKCTVVDEALLNAVLLEGAFCKLQAHLYSHALVHHTADACKHMPYCRHTVFASHRISWCRSGLLCCVISPAHQYVSMHNYLHRSTFSAHVKYTCLHPWPYFIQYGMQKLLEVSKAAQAVQNTSVKG